MFKVQENGDGSTSIFDNNTGSLICTIRSQQRNMGLGCRPVNVVGPSPQPVSNLYNLDLKSDCSSDEDQKSSRNKGCMSPLPDEPKEDFYEDCITPEEFARCLNLVSIKKIEDTPIDQLNLTFPLRHHARTKSVQISEDLQDLKIPDDVPLTSCLGVKLLKLNPQKNFQCDQAIAQKIKNYDSFCRFQLNTPTACNNFPKLRCREKKEYPVYLSHKFSKSGPTHTYTFNKRQRLEKMITIKTGLDTRSRRILLEKCKKRLAVRLKRLTKDEIQVWLSKKSSIVRPITLDCIKDERILNYSDSETTLVDDGSVPYVSLSSSSSESSSSSSDDSEYSPVNISLQNKIVSFKGVLDKSKYFSPTKADKYLSPTKSVKYLSPSKSVKCLSPSKSVKCLSTPVRTRHRKSFKILKHGSFKYKDSYVKMNNILKRVCKYLGDYYVRGTPIRIPFLSEYLNKLSPKAFDMSLVLDIDAHLRPSSSLVLNTNVKTNCRHDHAYHLPFQNKLVKKSSAPYCLNNHKSSQANLKELHQVNSKVLNKPNILPNLNCVNKSLSIPLDNLKIIPIIDLTKDSPPKTPIKRWIFRCYGCGFEKIFTSDSGFKTYGIKHLQIDHSVSEPESFLSFSCSPSGSGIIMEAFPGFKDRS